MSRRIVTSMTSGGTMIGGAMIGGTTIGGVTIDGGTIGGVTIGGLTNGGAFDGARSSVMGGDTMIGSRGMTNGVAGSGSSSGVRGRCAAILMGAQRVGGAPRVIGENATMEEGRVGMARAAESASLPAGRATA